MTSYSKLVDLLDEILRYDLKKLSIEVEAEYASPDNDYRQLCIHIVTKQHGMMNKQPICTICIDNKSESKALIKALTEAHDKCFK